MTMLKRLAMSDHSVLRKTQGRRTTHIALLLAALVRMRHDCGNSNKQAAIQRQAIKGGFS